MPPGGITPVSESGHGGCHGLREALRSLEYNGMLGCMALATDPPYQGVVAVTERYFGKIGVSVSLPVR